MRGSLSFRLNDSAFDARPYSLTGQTVEKAPYSQGRLNISFGGPLFIPKLFRSERTNFFVDYSLNRGRDPFQGIATLPTQAQRSGDFSQPLTQPFQIFDPLGRAPLPANRVPASRISPISNGLLAFVPLPNQPGTVQNYQFVTSVDNARDQFSSRVSHSFSAKDRVDASVNFQWRDSTNAQLYGFLDTQDGLGFSINPGWTHTFRRNLIHSLRVNFSRNRNETLPFFAFGRDVAGELGIGGVARDPINFGPPNLNFTNFGGLTDASPILRRDQTIGFTDSISYIKASHTVSVGGGYRWMRLDSRTDQNARGTFSFSGLATSQLSPQGSPLPNTGFDFADFLFGLPQSSSIRFGAANTYFRAGAFNAFAQDDWRMRSNLTLNLGVRYEYFRPFQEKFDHIANLDISPEFNAVSVVLPGGVGPYTGTFPRGLVDPDSNNVSPRLALAYRPSPKRSLQIRAGYGVFFNGSVYNQFPTRMAAQPPFANTASVNTSLTRTLTLSNGFATAPSQSITNTYAVDRRYRTPYAQTWNFSVQHNVGRNLVAEIGYLGTKGTKLDLQRMPNRAAPGSPLTAEQRRQIGNAVGFVYDTSEGNSIYHAGQARLTRRFSNGMSWNLFYTFGKSLDNASSLGGAGGGAVAQNDKDLRAERGRSSFDQRHSLNIFYVLTSPVRDSTSLFASSPTVRQVLRGWTLSGGLTATSGTPLTARVLGNQADASGTGVTGSGRADATGLPLYEGGRFFNPAAFAIPPSGRFGNSSRNAIDGPARVSLNLGLGRSFRLSDRRSVEVRAESQNFTNMVNFTNVGTIVNAINYGLATNTARMRTVTLTARLRF